MKDAILIRPAHLRDLSMARIHVDSYDFENDINVTLELLPGDDDDVIHVRFLDSGATPAEQEFLLDGTASASRHHIYRGSDGSQLDVMFDVDPNTGHALVSYTMGPKCIALGSFVSSRAHFLH
jgi:hypothetical protein